MGCCKSDELCSFVHQVYDVKDLETIGIEAQFRAVWKKEEDTPSLSKLPVCIVILG